MNKLTEPTDPVIAALCADLQRRSAVGITKYGTTLARTDVDLRGWLVHALEEALDQAAYLKRAIMEIDGAGERVVAADTTPRCTFCGKGSAEVECLFAAPHAWLCSECVDACTAQLKTRRSAEAPLPPVSYYSRT